MVKSKGFRPPKRTATLTFEEGHDYHGAEVSVRLDVPMSVVFEFDSLSPADGMRRFGDEILIDWNIEDDDGNPVPATADGLLSQSSDFGLALLDAWKESAAGVPTPLGRR